MSRQAALKVCTVLLALVLPAGVAMGQSLGELAETSKKKRKGGVHVFNEDDLKKRSPAASPSAAPPASGRMDGAGAGSEGGGEAGSGEAGGEGGSGEEGRARSSGRNDEAYWRAEAAKHYAAMAAADERRKAAQERLNALLSDLVPGGVNDPFQQQTLEAERAKARQNLQDAEKEFELAEDAFQAFEEEARQKGVPPGWLEER